MQKKLLTHHFQHASVNKHGLFELFLFRQSAADRFWNVTKMYHRIKSNTIWQINTKCNAAFSSELLLLLSLFVLPGQRGAHSFTPDKHNEERRLTADRYSPLVVWTSHCGGSGSRGTKEGDVNNRVNSRKHQQSHRAVTLWRYTKHEAETYWEQGERSKVVSFLYYSLLFLWAQISRLEVMFCCDITQTSHYYFNDWS